MSLYQFMAGNHEFKEFSKGIKYVSDDMIIIEDEDRVLEIFVEEPNEDTLKYTTMKNIACFQICSFESMKEELYLYIKEVMNNQPIIEIWSTWLDEYTTPLYKEVSLKDFDIEDLTWICGDKYFEHVKCLKIIKDAG